ncbi:hypothetical protein [Hyphomicrobium sp. 99]|uniref:hypothetical protein n=1 Tax=Hyphomicrobium sp. 99 TaxID=1163419 RepID=UPI0005F7A788|nr:hypothetical protein [Hyphomicrobium sp. 99]
MSTNDTRRDEVLFAFHEACEHPTAEQILEWTSRYPEFADDIIAHAEHQLSWKAQPELHGVEPDEADIARNWSWTLNAIYDAEKAGSLEAAKGGETFSQLLERAGVTIPALARRIEIDRLVLGELNAGRLRLPIDSRLLQALSNALGSAASDLEQSIARTLSAPMLGNAKASNKPEVHTQSYEAVILNTDMSEEKKNYWLGRDSPWTPGGISG